MTVISSLASYCSELCQAMEMLRRNDQIKFLLQRLHIKSVTIGIIIGMGMYKFWMTYQKLIVRGGDKNFIPTDCLFFTPKKLQCDAKCSNNENGYQQIALVPCNNCSINRLISVLKRTQHKLDICMYLITCDFIFNTILILFKKGVKVRIIVDQQMSEEAQGNKVSVIRREYVPVKVIKSYMMHNKFAVMDHEIVITGSLNWTRQGIIGNYENVIISNNSIIAHKYAQHFEFMWNLKE